MHLPFGITSAPGYFQEIMDQLTSDLPRVAVYLDDTLVSRSTAQEHLNNLKRLLQRLSDKGLRCRLEKCLFAQPYVEYLGHLLSSQGVAKSPKVVAVDAVQKMSPSAIPSLRSFLGSVQFYSKFLPNLSTHLEALYHLTKKNSQWIWDAEEQAAFDTVKSLLCYDTVLAHFDSSLSIGIACDASNVGIGAVLFHRYEDGSERPIANASKTLRIAMKLQPGTGRSTFNCFCTEKGPSFSLRKEICDRSQAFAPTKATPQLAGNHLARWALMLSQYSRIQEDF